MKFDAESGDGCGQTVTEIYGWVKSIFVLKIKGLEHRTVIRTLNTTKHIPAMSTAIQNCKHN